MIRKSVETLDERCREMLALLIKTHIATGEPVGSRVISKLTSEGLSPATVRNIIVDLEEAGYLEQPHTSAGRVPSHKGYRFYVDHILEQTQLSESDETVIQLGMLGALWPNADQLMSRASHLLSSLSESVGIVILPSIAHDIIKHIDFVRLSDGRILVITVSRAGIVQDRLVRIDEDLTQDELNWTANYVNANFSGMSLFAIRTELLKRLSEEKALYDRLLQNAAMLCERGLSETEQAGADVFVEGASNIVTNPDFADTERMRELLRIFEEKSRLIKILNECVGMATGHTVTIRIGQENSLPSLHGCSVITSYYSCGDQVIGNLGIVGPVRLEYARTIGVVNYVARRLEKALADA
ncbi:MAG: heat-inducible transcriptional repressor HrcA, partial [Acidobacteria bacterium]|nr:heat-inducible transcriptional repressor HrcA [Acidobacteriota bacterium]